MPFQDFPPNLPHLMGHVGRYYLQFPAAHDAGTGRITPVLLFFHRDNIGTVPHLPIQPPDYILFTAHHAIHPQFLQNLLVHLPGTEFHLRLHHGIGHMVI